MAKRDPRIDKYIHSRASFARPVLKHLRSVIRAGGPKLEESIKWGMPAFLHKGKIVCGIAGFKAHCALWFWRGKAVIGNQAKGAMGSFGRISSIKDLPSPSKIKAYVKKGIRLSEEPR